MAKNIVVKFFTEGFYNGSNKIKLKKVKMEGDTLIIPTSFASFFDFILAPLGIWFFYFSIDHIMKNPEASETKWWAFVVVSFLFAFSSTYNILVSRSISVSSEGLVQSVVQFLFLKLKENYPKQSIEFLILDRKRKSFGGYMVEIFVKPKWDVKASLAKTNCDASNEIYRNFLTSLQNQLNKSGLILSPESKAYLKEIIHSKE